MVCVRNGGGLMKIGDIVTKNEYTQYAIWCNKNNAHIEKQDGKYIVVANVELTPTIDEQIKALDQQYNSNKAVLMPQYTEAMVDDDSDLMASIKAELVALREQYDKSYEKIMGGEE